MKTPIRVAHVIGKMSFGGAETVVMNYYRNIDREKIQFDFIVLEESDLPCKDEIESLGGRIIIIPSYNKIASHLKELKRVFKENNYHIVHSHINTLSIFPLCIAKMCNIKTRIAHVHSTAGKAQPIRNIIKYILRPFSKIFSTDYFACTKYAGNWLFGKKTFMEKGIVINNAVDLEKFKYDENIRTELRKELKIENKFVIGHVGRFVKVKNQGFIVDIFNEIQKEKGNSILLFIGDKYGSTGDKHASTFDELKCKVKKLNLEGKVIFLPPRNDIHKIYQAFDLFLFPSLYEGLGMVLIEAQIAGLPCITSDAVPADAKISNLATFLSLSKTADYWSKKCIELSDVKRKSHVDEAKKNSFDIVEEAKKLEKIYTNYIERTVGLTYEA